MSKWRAAVLGLLLLCFLGLHQVEAAHLHFTAAQEQDCAVCKVCLHQPLEVPPPPLSPLAFILVLLFFRPRWQATARRVGGAVSRPNSRAPPRLSAV
ncbi:MAG TPA: hypothetical protein VMV91_06445 [Rhodocyclaceae bacterium]|nr:hypothetical protein [Rhodocyclaceae bacterium]